MGRAAQTALRSQLLAARLRPVSPCRGTVKRVQLRWRADRRARNPLPRPSYERRDQRPAQAPADRHAPYLAQQPTATYERRSCMRAQPAEARQLCTRARDRGARSVTHRRVSVQQRRRRAPLREVHDGLENAFDVGDDLCHKARGQVECFVLCRAIRGAERRVRLTRRVLYHGQMLCACRHIRAAAGGQERSCCAAAAGRALGEVAFRGRGRRRRQDGQGSRGAAATIT